MRTTFSRLVIPAALLAAVAACADQPSGPSGPDETLTAGDRAALNALGLSAQGASDHGSYFVVEGDIEVNKADLRAGRLAPAVDPHAVFHGAARAGANLPGRRIPAPGPGGPRLQAYTNTLASASRVRNIRVDLSALAGQPAWLAAARAALSHWTGIVGSAVTMVEGGPADITVVIQNLNDTRVIARASWPSDATGGGPGPILRINSQNLGISDSWKENTMTHELGHTIGLRHTDWQANGETAGTLGANFVQGTSSNDPNSVMQAVVHNWTGFTAFDQRAAITLYGDTTQLSISYTASGPLVSWAAIPGAVSYNLNVLWVGWENYNDPVNPDYSYGSTVYDGRAVGSTTGTSLLDTTSSYTGTSSCYRYAFPGDPNWSGGSYTSYYWLEAVFANGETHSHAVALICQ